MTLVYLVGLLLGFLAELLRFVAARRLKEFTDHYEYVSMHDSLTGLANQNLLAKYLEDISNNKDKYSNLGCLFVDVDAFKNVNDSYGHLFGNAVLIKIAEILKEEKNAFVKNIVLASPLQHLKNILNSISPFLLVRLSYQSMNHSTSTTFLI